MSKLIEKLEHDENYNKILSKVEIEQRHNIDVYVKKFVNDFSILLENLEENLKGLSIDDLKKELINNNGE